MSSILTQAAQFSFCIVGQLRRCPDLEPLHLYQCYCDNASNRYILRRGILTIVTAEGDVI